MKATARQDMWRRVLQPGNVSHLLKRLAHSRTKADVYDLMYRSRLDILVTGWSNNKAVALVYHEKYHHAPMIVSIHSGAMVPEMCDQYRRDGVVVVESPALGRSLYRYAIRRTVPISIPERSYKAVAEIIAHLRQMREQGKVG